MFPTVVRVVFRKVGFSAEKQSIYVIKRIALASTVLIPRVADERALISNYEHSLHQIIPDMSIFLNKNNGIDAFEQYKHHVKTYKL